MYSMCALMVIRILSHLMETLQYFDKRIFKVLCFMKKELKIPTSVFILKIKQATEEINVKGENEVD